MIKDKSIELVDDYKNKLANFENEINYYEMIIEHNKLKIKSIKKLGYYRLTTMIIFTACLGLFLFIPGIPSFLVGILEIINGTFYYLINNKLTKLGVDISIKSAIKSINMESNISKENVINLKKEREKFVDENNKYFINTSYVINKVKRYVKSR